MIVHASVLYRHGRADRDLGRARVLQRKRRGEARNTDHGIDRRAPSRPATRRTGRARQDGLE
ncbi:MAG: hypothetical protein OXF98_09650, partial [Rhodospirillaceae bacterium]|nr:hypothetical protein [Rhodospirillaceae bacterium]